MAEIKSFKGIRYNKELLTNTEELVAPPYDVISPQQQDVLYKRNPHNIIRLILGKEQEDDDEKNNKYTRAAKYFRDWENQGILLPDTEPSIYFYNAKYQYPSGTERSLIGFISLIKLEEFSSSEVFPHEKTLPKPKKDRFNLLMECRATFDQVFSFFEDKGGIINSIFNSISSTQPVVDFATADDDIKHRLWRISDISLLSDIVNAMSGSKIFIADGHHRYETALNFRNHMKTIMGNNLPDSYNYMAMFFAPAENNDLSILATHRIIRNLQSFDKVDLLKSLKQYFDVKEISNLSEKNINNFLDEIYQAGKKSHAFGIYSGNGEALCVVLKDSCLSGEFLKDRHESYRKLDVVVLHSLIIENILGTSKADVEQEKNIIYTRNPVDAIKRVDSGECNLALYLNPPRIEHVVNVARAGEQMPQKSTYFYPKLLSGLVTYKLG